MDKLKILQLVRGPLNIMTGLKIWYPSCRWPLTDRRAIVFNSVASSVASILKSPLPILLTFPETDSNYKALESTSTLKCIVSHSKKYY